MTTTEPTVAGLDDQLTRLDNALTTLNAQRDGIEVELAAARTEWTERAALGDVDPGLTNQLKAFEGSLAAVDKAIGLNRERHEQAAAERRELVAAQELAADRAKYLADVAEFAKRPGAEAIAAAAKDGAYWLVRTVVRDLRDLNAEYQRLEAEWARHPGAPRPARQTDLAFTPDAFGRTSTQLWGAASQRVPWVGEQEAVAILLEYVRVRLWDSSRNNPNEPVTAPPLGG